MITITKRDIAKRIKERLRWRKLTQTEIEHLISDIFSEIRKAVLEENYKVLIRNFGRFEKRIINSSYAPTKEGKTIKVVSQYEIIAFKHSRTASRKPVSGGKNASDANS